MVILIVAMWSFFLSQYCLRELLWFLFILKVFLFHWMGSNGLKTIFLWSSYYVLWWFLVIPNTYWWFLMIPGTCSLRYWHFKLWLGMRFTGLVWTVYDVELWLAGVDTATALEQHQQRSFFFMKDSHNLSSSQF